MQISVIAQARNGFTDRFGIPRQPMEGSVIETRIVFEEQYRVREALRGIEGYSHLWLIWGFDKAERRRSNSCEAVGESVCDVLSWSPTVRPPRLGGNKRMGVFATRSPFRPNALGLSSVRLLRIEETVVEGSVLVVAGADLLDGTPIYDIKPYLSFSDSHPEAQNGFAEAMKEYRLGVEIKASLLAQSVAEGCPWEAVREILEQDPRPQYQHDAERVYRMEYGGWQVSFRVAEAKVWVEDLERV